MAHEKLIKKSQSYGMSGGYTFIGKPRDKVYLGIEYETGVPNNRVDEFIEGTEGMGFIGFDGTVRDENPVEFRAHPMGFEMARRHWNKFFKRYGDTVRQADGAGIHIHVSNVLPDPVWLRMFFFINRRSNRRYVYAMANRQSGGYNHYTDCGDTLAEAAKPIGGGYYSPSHTFPRYKTTSHGSAFAYNGNGTLGTERDPETGYHRTATHEIRIFKSTTDHRTFMSYIEFTRALLDFCKRTASEERLTPEGFAYYLRTKAKRYPNILARTEEYFKSL